MTTPLRRASVPVSPRRQRASFADDSCESQSAVAQAASAESNEESFNLSSGRRASFVSKASVFIDSTSAGGEMRSPQRISRHSTTSNPSSYQQSDNRSEGKQTFEESPDFFVKFMWIRLPILILKLLKGDISNFVSPHYVNRKPYC